MTNNLDSVHKKKMLDTTDRGPVPIIWRKTPDKQFVAVTSGGKRIATLPISPDEGMYSVLTKWIDVHDAAEMRMYGSHHREWLVDLLDTVNEVQYA